MTVPAEQAAVATLLTTLAGTAPVETHISAVFRGKDTVWKLKKAVKLGFLDFTNIAERRRLLEREVALNAPTVPGLYRDVVPVTQQDGHLTLDGPGHPVDWVLRMTPVPEGDFLDRMAEAGRIDTTILLPLADAVAAMHAAQPPTPRKDPLARMLEVIASNAKAATASGIDSTVVDQWRRRVQAALQAAGPAIQRRVPLIRRAHGDLHLGNIVLWQGRPAPCDALEFDEELATIDPAYDLAFLLMDLDQRVSRAAANLVLSRTVARSGDAGLVASLSAYLSSRAMIRAHVAASSGQNPTPLVQAALSYLQPNPPILVAVGGLMGTGKSTLARAIAPSLGPAPGALVLRSDEIRKRLHGVAPETPIPAQDYTPEANARTDAALLAAARTATAAGHAVVADATFLNPGFRTAIESVARAAGMPFLGVWLQAPMNELERRVAARRNDASDADLTVLRAAARHAAPPDSWLHIDATAAAAARLQVETHLQSL